jgi:hypothetical protein
MLEDYFQVSLGIPKSAMCHIILPDLARFLSMLPMGQSFWGVSRALSRTMAYFASFFLNTNHGMGLGGLYAMLNLPNVALL